jgi:putative acetyltransferase
MHSMRLKHSLPVTILENIGAENPSRQRPRIGREAPTRADTRDRLGWAVGPGRECGALISSSRYERPHAPLSIREPMEASSLEIREDDLSSEQTSELLHLHLAGMQANSPPGQVFALALSALRAPNITVWSAWRRGRIAGIGALKDLGDGTGEVKSMRTHPAFLRQGVAGALLEQIIATARVRGICRLSLETGSGPAFEAALALYRKRGFLDGEVFSDYVRSDFNQFLHLTL